MLRSCQSYSQLLQERLGNFGETSARDVFIATLSRVKGDALQDFHPFLISLRPPLLFTNEEEMKASLASPAPKWKNMFFVLKELLKQVDDLTSSENTRIYKTIKKLFLAEVPKKSKKMILANEEEESSLRADASCVLQNQKLFRWINFIYNLLEHDSVPVRSLINETLTSAKLNDDGWPLTKKVDLCAVRIARNLLVRGTLTSVNATDLKYGAFGGLYVLGGIYCDFVWTPEDRRELSKFFLCLPAGFGSYEKLYQKGFWNNTIAERLPFKEKDMDMPTIHFLGKIFFQCANSIAESIRLCVNHQLLTRHESGSSKGKSYVLPTKKFLFPIIFRRVASDWLKILNCVGLVIHPTIQMKEHLPGKRFTILFCVFAKHEFFIVSILFLCFDKTLL